MGLFDKFLDVMNLGGAEEDDFDEEFDDEVEEPKQERTSLFSHKPADEEIEEEDATIDRKVTSNRSGSKITPLHARRGNGELAVCVFKPTSFEDAREIGETLLAKQTVIINMEGVDVGLAQRIIDFASGATYALDGNLQKISNFIFIVTPANVSISGDLQDIVNAFDFSGIQTGF
ncbi:MAG: cell division protein SepF [Lachnospiraceae bacterium]|jgi:cell division inhibitor SepF|nr:cell division protein SepF [Lachnospiraceae bacterium]MDY5704886.1 cell division protein SepF [Lachnospiraceae bacterium]